MTREIGISELSNSQIAAHSRYYISCLFSRERCTYSNFCVIIFWFCFLYFVFDIYIIWFLGSNKTWFSERFPFLSRHELLLLVQFLFCFNVFIFYIFIWLPNLILIIIIIIMIIFIIIVVFIVIVIIIFSYSMLSTFIILVFIYFYIFV